LLQSRGDVRGPLHGPLFQLALADLPAGDALEIYVRREDAERFIEGGMIPSSRKPLQVEERELKTGGEN
jgi:hypothetical protein